jgi:hypothetical protein
MTEIERTPHIEVECGYDWIDDAWVDRKLKDLDSDTLTRVMQQGFDENGNWDASLIAIAAQDPAHPMHDFVYENDQAEAAHLWRCYKLQEVPRSVCVVVKDIRTGDVYKTNERAFESMGIYGRSEHANKYRRLPLTIRSTERALEDTQMKKMTVKQKSPQRESQPAALPIEPQPESTTTAQPEPQPEPQPQPLRVAAPSPAATNKLPEQHKRALGILKRWAESYRDNPYFAPIVAVVDSYPDPE